MTAGPGQIAEVRLAVPARAFARYDEVAGGWVWPPGEFAVRVGRSSADLPLSVQVKSLSFRTDRRSRGSGPPRAYHAGMRARAAAAVAGMALEPDGQRLLVSNYLSGQLEAVSIPSIP